MESQVSKQVSRHGSLSVCYYFWEVDEVFAQKIADLVYDCLASESLSNQSIFDSSYIKVPNCVVDLTKQDGRLVLDFRYKYPDADDVLLELIKSVDKRLKKEGISATIRATDKNGKPFFEYSDRTYRRTLFKNNFVYHLVIVVVMALGLLLLDFLSAHVGDSRGLKLVLDEMVAPALGYLVSVIAFNIVPKTAKTRILTFVVILLTVFLYYFITGKGLYGSLILLGLFILKSIQSSMS